MEGERRDVTVVTKLTRHFKSLYGFGGRRCSTFEMSVRGWILNHVSGSLTWFLFTLN